LKLGRGGFQRPLEMAACRVLLANAAVVRPSGLLSSMTFPFPRATEHSRRRPLGSRRPLQSTRWVMRPEKSPTEILRADGIGPRTLMELTSLQSKETRRINPQPARQHGREVGGPHISCDSGRLYRGGEGFQGFADAFAGRGLVLWASGGG